MLRDITVKKPTGILQKQIRSIKIKYLFLLLLVLYYLTYHVGIFLCF